MYFNLSQLLRVPGGSTRVYEINEQVAVEDGPERLWVRGTVKLLRTVMGVWVSAVLGTEVLCICSRCLEQYTQAIEMIIEEEALPQPASETSTNVVGADGLEEGPTINERHLLDLSETVNQYTALCIPIKPVCRNNCKGLCPTCGANLNGSPCRCDVVVIDTRWTPLLDLTSSNENTESRNN